MSDIFEDSSEGRISAIEEYIKSGGEVNITGGKYNLSPLQYAAYYGQREAAQLLVSAGANVNYQDSDGSSPAHYAAMGGHTSTLEFLVSAGVDPNIKNGRGNSPSHWAATWGHTSTLEVLVSADADPNIKNGNGDSPAHRAAIGGHTSTLEVLVSAGADFNIKNGRGESPAHMAAYRGHTSTLEVLVSAGADPNIKNVHGNSPAYIAAKWGHTSTLDYLVSVGVDTDGLVGAAVQGKIFDEAVWLMKNGAKFTKDDLSSVLEGVFTLGLTGVREELISFLDENLRKKEKNDEEVQQTITRTLKKCSKTADVKSKEKAEDSTSQDIEMQNME